MVVVTIHVFEDASAGQSDRRDYTCEVKLLLKHMRYFKTFLQGEPGVNQEISVQCNLRTFDWLMAYVKAGITGVQPWMDCSNCIPILIACNYLKMAQLVREAVTFLATNILQLAASGADISGLDGALITKIAKATTEEALEQLLQQCQQVQPPQLRGTTGAGAAECTAPGPNSGTGSIKSSSLDLLQKLYKHKLEALLKDHNTTLLRCSACQQLFSLSSHKKLQCPALVGQATERLKVLPLHQVNNTWSFHEFLKQQRQPAGQQARAQGPPVLAHTHQQHQQQHQQQQHCSSPGPTAWRDLYWLTWGHVTVLYCQQCHQHFPARQLCHCTSHPLAPVFTSEVDPGMYPCCGRPAWRPGLPLAYSQGCCAGAHQAALQQQQQQQQVDTVQRGATARALQLLSRFGHIILEPYQHPPLPPCDLNHLPSLAAPLHDATAAAASARASGSEAGAGGSSCNSSRCCSSSSSRPRSRDIASGSQSLPLLLRMTNRASIPSSPRMLSCTGGVGTGESTTLLADASPRLACTGLLPVAGQRSPSPMSAADTAAAAAARSGSGLSIVSHGRYQLGGASRPGAVQGDISSSSSSDEQTDSEEDALDEFRGELDYRSAHLRSFMDAVRAAALSRNRGSSLLGLGSISVGRMQAEVGVPLGSTFSSAGAARNFGRHSMHSQLNSQQQQNSNSSHALVRPRSRQCGQLAPTYTSSSKAAEGHLDSQAAKQTATGPPGSTRSTAAAVAPDMQANRVNRTLLLELMHEDDVYRMGLLMRKLDAVRLQPSPDEAATARRGSSGSTSSHLMSEEQINQAVNCTLFEGIMLPVRVQQGYSAVLKK